ncbi:hypothetical protein CEUSTIGMA_g11250.t1 [Chlamydomonas eustigma]|uniref:Uncharacterized protein n=1 Tax=Chlamydomonas eustigma TaxID=1157962 RepID=A0A250XLB6_9CHLO|nr:hypothetical protein CEUSTIGMA_g11250.t1 [Chlamydomonas eustigma]|eukprot:GAX83826.1 hypothetical protein CEUSTIGMA_g11250.t1 [Chlamydomonas eustigma]
MWTSSFTGFSSRVKDSREEKISVSHISAETESKKDTDSAKDKGLRTDIQSQHSPSNPVKNNETNSKSLLESSTDEGFQLRSRQRDAINFELLEPQAVNEGNVDTAVKDVTLQPSLLSEPFSESSAVNVPKKSNKVIAAQQYNLRGKLKNEELLAILRRNQEQPQAQSAAVTQPIEKNRGQQESVEKTERTRTKPSVEDAEASEPQALIQYIDALLKRTEEVHPIPTAPVHAKGTHPHQYDQGFGDNRSRTNKTGRPLKGKQEAKREPQEVEPTAALHVQPTAKEEAAPPAVQKAAASKHGLPSSTTVGAASQSKQPAKPQSKQMERSLSPALTPDQQQKHNKFNSSNKVAATMHQTTGHSVLPQQRRQARPSNKVQDQALLQGLQVLGAAMAPQQGTTVLAAESAGSARQGGHAAVASFKMGHSSITVTSSAVKNKLSSSGAPSSLKSAAGGGNKDAQLSGQMEGKRVHHMSVMKGPAEQLGCILGSEASELIRVLHADAHGEDGTRYSPPSLAGPVYSPGPSTFVGHNTVTSSPSRPPSQTSPSSGSHPQQASPQLITCRQGGWAAEDSATATSRLPSPSKVLGSESSRHHDIEQSNASYHVPSITLPSYPSKSPSKLAPGLETAHLLKPDLTFHHVSKISSAVQTEDIGGEAGYSRWQPLGAELAAQISQPQKVRPTRPEYLHSSVTKLTTCDSIGAEAAAAAGTSAALSVHVTTSAVSELIRRFREAPPRPREQRNSTAAAAGPLRSRDVQDVEPDDDTISHRIIGTDEQLKDGNQNPGIGVSQPGYLNLDYSVASPSKMLSWRNHQTVEGATEINRPDLNMSYLRGRRPRRSSSSSDEEEDEEMNDETGSTSLAAAETGVKPDLSKLNDVMSEEEQEVGYEVSAMSRKHQRTYLELKRLLVKRQRTPGSHDRSMIVAGERDDDRRMSSMLVRSEGFDHGSQDATKRSPERETNGQGSAVDGLASALLNRSRSVLRERDQIQERIHAALLKIRHDGPAAGSSTTSPGTVPAVSSRLSGAVASAVPRSSLHVKSHSRVPDLFPQEAAGFDRQKNRGSSTNDVAAAAESCVVKVPISGGDLLKEQISWRDQLKALLREASVDKQTNPQAALSAHAERMQVASASSTSVHAFTETSILSQQAQAAITGSSAALTSPAPLHEGSIKLSSSRVHETSDMILPSSRVQHASGDSSIRTEQYSLKLLPLQNLSHTPLSVTQPLLVPPDIDQLLALLASRFGLAPRGLVVGDTKIAYVVPEVTTAVSGQISPPVPATRRQGLADNAISSEATTGRVEGETSVVAAGALYDASKTMWHDAEEMPEKERASGSHFPLTQSSLTVAPEAAAAQGLASNDRLSAMNNAILFSPLLDVQEGEVTTTCKTDSYTSDALYDAYQQDGPIHDERLNSPANVADTVDSATPSRRRWSISSPSSEKASDSFKSETGSGRIWKGAADTLSATAHVSAGSSPTASLPLTINEPAGLQQEVSNGGTPPRSPLPSTTSLLTHTPAVSTDGSSKPWRSSRRFLDRPVVMQMPQAAEGSRLPESPVMISCLVLDHHKAKMQPLQQSAPPYFGPASEEYSIRFNTDGSTRSVNGIIPQNDDDGSAADDHVAPVAFSPLLGRLLYHSVTANLFAESPFTSVATLSSDEESDCEDASVVGARRMHAAHLETSAGSENGFEQDLEATHDENLSANRYFRQRCHTSNANRGTELHTASDSGSPPSNGPAIRVVYTSHVDDITRARASETTSDAERVYQWSSGVEESVSDHYLSSSVRESCWEESGEQAAKGPKPLFEATTRWSLDTERSAQHCGGPDLHAAASGDVSGIINPLLIATTVTTSLFEIDCGNISSTVAEDRCQDNKDQESWWRERGRNNSSIEGASRDVNENELNACSRAEIMSDQDYQDPSLAISMDVSLDQQTAARVSIVASTGPAAENEMTSNNLDYAIFEVQKEEGVDRALQAEVSHHQATTLPNACSNSFSPEASSDSNGPASAHVAANGPASAHVVAANGPASAHVVAANGPASAHVAVAANGPASAHVVAANGPTSAHVLAANGPASAHVVAANGPASAHVVVAANGPASAHVVAANGPASAHVVAANGPASARVVAARRPVPLLHPKLTSSVAPTLLSATMGCHEALHDHAGTDRIRCTESATDITSRTSSETTHSEVSGLRSHHGSKEGSDEGVSGGGVSTDDDEGCVMSNAGGSKHAELRPFMLGGQYGCMDGRSSVHSHGSELYLVRDAMSSLASSPPWAGLPPCSITVLDEDNDVQQNEISGDNNPKCTERLEEEHIEELDLKEVDENQEMVDGQVLLFQETIIIPDVDARSVETSVDIIMAEQEQEEGRGVEIESEHNKQEEDRGVEIGGEHSWDEHFGMDYGHGPDDIATQYVSHEVGEDKQAMIQVVQHELMRQHAVLHQCTSSWASSSTLKPMQIRPTSHDSSESASRGKPGGTHRPTTPEETREQWEQQQQQVQQYLSSSTQNQPTKTSGLLTSQSITVHASSLADLPTLYHPTSTLSSSVIVEEDVVMKLLHEKILTCVGQLRDINQRLT